MIRLIFGRDLKDNMQYYLTDLDTYESFDRVINELENLGLSLVSQLDAIHYRIAIFSDSGREFKIIYHEDVGVHGPFVSHGEDDSWLQKILSQLAKNLNK